MPKNWPKLILSQKTFHKKNLDIFSLILFFQLSIENVSTCIYKSQKHIDGLHIPHMQKSTISFNYLKRVKKLHNKLQSVLGCPFNIIF